MMRRRAVMRSSPVAAGRGRGRQGTGLLGYWRHWRRTRRQERALRNVRDGLRQRGMVVDHMTDAELIDLIGAGRRALGRARVRGTDITAAYVMLVRQREHI